LSPVLSPKLLPTGIHLVSPGLAECAPCLMEGLKYFAYLRNALFLHVHQIFGYLNHACILHLNHVSNNIHTTSGPFRFVKRRSCHADGILRHLTHTRKRFYQMAFDRPDCFRQSLQLYQGNWWPRLVIKS
jgi:hypothetical protein